VDDGPALQPEEGPKAHAVGADAPIYERLSSLLRVGVGIGLAPVVVGLAVALIEGSVGEAAVALIRAGVVMTLALPPLQALVAALAYRGQSNGRFAWVAGGVLVVQLLAALMAWTR
jgi:hypothetical protein